MDNELRELIPTIIILFCKVSALAFGIVAFFCLLENDTANATVLFALSNAVRLIVIELKLRERGY